jgi:KUP system potassium uptake protein
MSAEPARRKDKGAQKSKDPASAALPAAPAPVADPTPPAEPPPTPTAVSPAAAPADPPAASTPTGTGSGPAAKHGSPGTPGIHGDGKAGNGDDDRDPALIHSPIPPRKKDQNLTPFGVEAIQPPRHHAEANPTGKRLAGLTLAALGVVYGDIGTSPLYSIKECFKASYGLAPTPVNVYGVLSLILWALILVVSVKYVAFILRADNRGEGGVLALLALVLQRAHRAEDWRRRSILIGLGLFGGAFLYGDGIITPAISVLGAVEGLEVLAPNLARFVVPISAVIIAVLFYFQYKGTARVGAIFGPVMATWFVTIAVLGIRELVTEPRILTAVNPWYAIHFFILHPQPAFIVLGAVVLVITGGEALYADMGHFGKKPIRIAWFALVLPALVLNYFGQGALLLRDPAAIDNPFYHLAPRALLLPLIILAAMAAIVASQALISGAFSLTQQAVQLGYMPRMTIVHTSRREAGQIYIPEINKALAVGTLLLVVAFRSADALGAAYGVAVTGTMAITTVLFYVITRHRWHWPAWKAISFLAFFLAIDLLFFAANLLKVQHGGWVPLLLAVIVFMMMTTWKKGRAALSDILRRGTLPVDMFLESIGSSKPVRVAGTAVFMTSDPEGVPVVLLHHLKHNKVLHHQVVLLSIVSAEYPEVPIAEKVSVEPLLHGFYRVKATYGFMEKPDVKEILARCNQLGLKTRPNDTSYFLGRERLIATGSSKMMGWRKSVFIFMSRNARSATEFFNIPPNRVVELGTQIEF